MKTPGLKSQCVLYTVKLQDGAHEAEMVVLPPFGQLSNSFSQNIRHTLMLFIGMRLQ